jgi:putative tryptophan/tyrosine transport system substrate-binding protein
VLKGNGRGGKLMKKLSMILIASFLVILAACGTSDEDKGGARDGDADYVVGIIQHVEHPSLDQATEGFKKALEDAGLKVKFDEENAQNDVKNNQAIAQKFVGDKVDLIFANATPSAQAAVNETKEIPIVFTSVTDPVGAGLVASMEQPGGNVTGTSDNNPEAIPSTLQLIKDMGYETVGTVYNAGEQNSVTQVDQVKAEAEKLGLTVKEANVSTSAEVKQAAESLAGSVDVFYIITDNTVVSSLESVIIVSEQEKIPLFVGELDSVKRGGFAGFGFSYYDIGYEAGEKAVQILKGEAEPGEIPATFPQKLVLEINEDAAQKMGVEISEELKAKATLVKTQQQ